MDDTAFLRPPAALAAILADTNVLGFPMASEPRTGAMLRMLAASKPGGRFLELGTGTGISTAWLLDGMDASATLLSVDTDATFQDVARRHLGGDRRLELVVEDGAAFLRRQPSRSFDLVFADAMPGKYDALDEALASVKVGGFYAIDDMLPQANWPDGHSARVATLLPDLLGRAEFSPAAMAWSSGLVVLARRA